MMMMLLAVSAAGFAQTASDAKDWGKADMAALTQAAEAGDVEAQFELGSRYAVGKDVAEDATEAAKWYEKAAEGGHGMAQYVLGVCYEHGVGVEENAEVAKGWFEKAAAQDIPLAKDALEGLKE